MSRVLVAGLATLDLLLGVEAMPVRAEKHRARSGAMVGGGGAANAAVAIARLGGEAVLAARIGEDAVGDMILDGLRAEGVGTSLIRRCAGGRSAFSSVLVDAAGERQIVSFRGDGLEETPDFDASPSCDAVLVDTRCPAMTRAALGIARKRGIPGVADGEHPMDPDDLADATHVAFSAQGLVGLTGIAALPEALDAASVRLSAWLCVTDGAAGALYRRDGEIARAPAHPVEAVDTLAAGDVWHGAFALRLAEGADERAATVFANAAASLKCAVPGGRDGCPDRMAVERLLREGEGCGPGGNIGDWYGSRPTPETG